MLLQIWSLLKAHRAYRLVVLGALFSSMGSGLTQVAVYGELGRMGASPMAFALAFGLSLLPGLFSSELGRVIAHRYQPLFILAGLELLGAVSVLLPIWGSQEKSAFLLQLSQFVGAILTGMMIPASSLLISRYFKDQELPAVSGISNYVFSANVLVGFGVGAFLFGVVPAHVYFLVDIASFVFSGAMILAAYAMDTGLRMPPDDEATSVPGKFRWSELSTEQRRAFLLLPALTIAGTPAVALLPVLAQHFGASVAVNGVSLSSVTLFLFAKALGQLVGPVLVKPEAFDTMASSPSSVRILIALFGVTYLIAAVVPSVLAAWMLVVLAHVLSNMVYVVATYAIPRHFKGVAAMTASARQYQAQILLMTVYSSLSGWAALWVSVPAVILANFVISSALVYWLTHSRRTALCLRTVE